MVSQRCLHPGQSQGFKGSHLSCARRLTSQCQRTVKLHRVFSSFRDQDGICTVTEISPGLASRQCSDRYTIRAGRNFKDGSPGGEPGPRSKPGRTTPTLASNACFLSHRDFDAPVSPQGSDYIIIRSCELRALSCEQKGTRPCYSKLVSHIS